MLATQVELIQGTRHTPVVIDGEQAELLQSILGRELRDFELTAQYNKAPGVQRAAAEAANALRAILAQL